MRLHRIAIAALAGSAGVVACFPSFDFGDGSSDSGSTSPIADATLDQTSPGSDGNAPVTPDGGGDSQGHVPISDASTDGAKSSAFDASDMIHIEAGTFEFDNFGTGIPATLSHDFLVDTYEVTNARFAAWVNAGLPAPCATGTCSLEPNGPYASSLVWDSEWNFALTATGYTIDGTCNPAGNTTATVASWTVDGGGTFPVACVNWFQAVSFCAFENKRLLTETEWAYVASGRGQGRGYPWGNKPPDSACDQAIWSFVDAGENNCHWPVPVGSTPNGVSLDGVYDMAGGVFEWVWDWYDEDGSYPGGTDYTGPVQDSGPRVDRGGSWADSVPDLSTSNRDTTGPGYTFEDLGIRCARTL